MNNILGYGHKPTLLGLVKLFFGKSVLLTATVVSAQTVNEVKISNFPIDGGLPPEPNILLLMDDSASMDWEVVAKGNVNSVMQIEYGADADIGNRYFFYSNLYSNDKNPTATAGGSAPVGSYGNYHSFRDKDGHAVPTAKAVYDFSQAFSAANAGATYDFLDQLNGVWRARSPDFNPLYYNPNIRYRPWPGYALDFTTPGAAVVNPNFTGDTVNLTSPLPIKYLFRNPNQAADESASANPLNINAVAYQANDASTYVASSIYIPMYYTYNDANTSGTVDAGECYRLIEIKPTYEEKDCVGNTITAGVAFEFVRGADRTDCDAIANSENRLCDYTDEINNFTNWFTYYRKKEFAAKAAFATAVSSPEVNDVRLGYSTVNVMDPARNSYLDINGNAVTMGAKAYVGTDKEDVRDAIYETTSGSGGTQLLRALEGAGQYFKCTTTNHDVFDNATAYSTGDSQCPRFAADEGGACQANMTVLMSDGFWEVEGDTAENDHEKTNGVDFPVSYAEQDNVAADYFTGGAFANSQLRTLADVAMYWYKNDLDDIAGNNDQMPMAELLDIPRINQNNGATWDGNPFMHQHMKTYTIGFAVFNESSAATDPLLSAMDANGNWAIPADPSAAIAWPAVGTSVTDSNKLEDIKHAAYNGRGRFYAANNASQLIFGLNDAIKSNFVMSGAGSAVSFNSDEIDEANGAIAYAAQYNTATNSGDVIAYEINPDGSIGTQLWSANQKLNSQVSRAGDCTSSTTRNIVTFDPYTNAGIEFTGIQGRNLSANEVDWMRGLNSNEDSCPAPGAYRNRSELNAGGTIDASADAKLIGDIVSSRPLYVGAPNFEYRFGDRYPATDYDTYATAQANRTPLVLVGTNGGLFHAFDGSNVEADRGKEVFAYVPNQIMNDEPWMNQAEDLLNPQYSHKWYLDLSPAVNDVYIHYRESSGTSTTRAWRTIALGGYRGGGKGYYALDVTNDGETNVLTEARNSVMWEFGVDSLATADQGKLGLSYSTPTMSMTNEAHTTTGDGYVWKAMFGNGYNSESGTASLFLVDLEGGYNGWSATEYDIITPTSALAGPASDGRANGLSTPRGIDINGDGTIDFAYAGDLRGNVWRFDLRDDTTAGVTGMSASARAQLIFQTSSADNLQPITTQPMVVAHPYETGKYVVIVTTGSWLTREDSRNETDIHTIYGITDDPTTTPTVPTLSDLEQRSLTQSGIYRSISDVDTTDQNLVQNGWYLNFIVGTTKTGERAIRNMTYRGGYIFLATVIPGGVGCSAAMSGSILALNAQTGLAGDSIFDFNGDGSFGGTNEDNAGMIMTDKAPSDLAMIGDTLFLQETSSTGVVTQKSIKTNTDQPGREGRLSWRQLK